MKILEKITDSINLPVKYIRKFTKNHAKVELTLLVVCLGGYFTDKNVETAKADGSLGIYNSVATAESTTFCFIQYSSDSGVSDGYDGEPIDITADLELYFTGTSGLYSVIPDYTLAVDTRPVDSNTPFNLKLIYIGTISTSTENHLEVNFYVPPEPPFDNKPIILESNCLPYGFAVDVRRVIENANQKNIEVPTIPLKNLSAGIYDQYHPYGSATVTIGTRFLEDLDGDGKVTMKDFAILASQWGKPQGTYTGDISGPNTVPNGFVDYYDLSAFHDDYLKDINDPNTW